MFHLYAKKYQKKINLDNCILWLLKVLLKRVKINNKAIDSYVHAMCQKVERENSNSQLHNKTLAFYWKT